jgi:hypothetical protein
MANEYEKLVRRVGLEPRTAFAGLSERRSVEFRDPMPVENPPPALPIRAEAVALDPDWSRQVLRQAGLNLANRIPASPREKAKLSGIRPDDFDRL